MDQNILMTTTPTVEGRAIGDYLGIVTGEAILGANTFKDLFGGGMLMVSASGTAETLR